MNVFIFENIIMCCAVSDNSALAQKKDLVTSLQERLVEDWVSEEKKWRCLEDLAQHSKEKASLTGAATCQNSSVQFASKFSRVP